MSSPGRRAAGLATLLLLTACGEDGGGKPAASSTPSVTVEDDGTQVIALSETEDYRFVPDEPHLVTGAVRIDMTNSSKATTHSLAFKPGGPPEEIPFLNPGESSSISFVIAQPGEYQFFCTFHESLGQRGVLVVDQP